MKNDSQHVIKFKLGDGSIQDGRITISEKGERVSLSLELGTNTISATADDGFDAFCEIRRSLELEGIYPECIGAARHVFPSGMCRSMGNGLMAYKLVLGSQALTKDLVNIFDHEGDFSPATVDEQEAFFDEWIASLRS